MPEISIVLPVYNGERYLRQSVESVISQTFADWELIIVDDCSTDLTPVIAEEYSAKDNRIRVIHNSLNQKLPNSLNIGFDNSSGRFLTWTSDDNVYHPEAIEEMHQYLLTQDDCMVCARMRYIGEDNAALPEQPDDFCKDSFYYKNFVGACFLYKRCILDVIGKYDNDMFCVEDYDYWMRIMNHYDRIGFIPKVLYDYRMHESSLSSTQHKKVRMQLAKMRIKYKQNIIDAFKSEPSYIWRIYLEFVEQGYNHESIPAEYLAEIPETMFDSFPEDNKKLIIFGSGYWGRKIASVLQDRACFFADNALQKVGNVYEGIEVKAFDALKEMNDKNTMHIIIAAYSDKSYEMAHQLLENDIHNYCSLPLLMTHMEE